MTTRVKHSFSLILALVFGLVAVQTAWAADITQNTAVVINKGNRAKYNNKSITGTVPGYDALKCVMSAFP